VKEESPPRAERIKEGLQGAISAARGERDDLVESWIDLEAVDEELRRNEPAY
jgi:hypothetical protein